MRHLLFHIYPLATPAGQKCLRWHLRQLERHASLFDGRLIFAIVTGEGLMSPEAVAKLLPARAEIIVRPNHPILGESCTLPMMLAKAYTLDPSDLIFYAHTKGMSQVNTTTECTTRWWSLAMYRWLLSDEALSKLSKDPFVGWLKFEGSHERFPDWSTWHYSGNFWWVRAAELFQQAWWLVVPTKWGAEAYPSTWTSAEHAACRYSFPANELRRSEDGFCHLYYTYFWNQFGIPMGPDADNYD